jgi:YVTN family beta-propeller protein
VIVATFFRRIFAHGVGGWLQNPFEQTLTASSKQPSAASLRSRAKAGHPYIYVVGANGTAVIDPSSWQLITIAPGIALGPTGFLVDNHYRDQSGRLWSVLSATQPVMPWEAPAMGLVSVWDGKTFRNEKTIDLGQNVVNTVGLTPDGKFAVVPVSTANELNVYDTSSFEQVATIPVGLGPWDMMVSPDGKYVCEPDANSDTLTIVDPTTWKVMAKVPTGEGTGPFMDTISPDSKFVSVECAGYHGGIYNGVIGPPAVPTGKGFTNTYVDLASQSVVRSIPLDFLAVWDEFTPDGKYDFIFGAPTAKTVVVDTRTFEVAETIKFQSAPSYITPDPNGKYVYASLKAGLQVIDTSSLQVVDTIPTGGVVGTPLLM